LGRKTLLLSLIVLSVIMCIPLVATQDVDEVTAWVDKPKYILGDRGTLFVAFYNNRDVAVAVKNITLVYMSWRAFAGGAWIGNETRTYDVPVSGKNMHLFGDITFSVPTDGRGMNTAVQITIGTDHGFESGSAYITVYENSPYMDRIISLLTLLVALMVVSAIILTAAILIASRTAQVVRIKKEEQQ